MSSVTGSSSLKRKRPDGGTSFDNSTDTEHVLYELIKSNQDVPISTREINKRSNLPSVLSNKILKKLETKGLIKQVVNIQRKSQKHYMAMEFEQSDETSGGTWYADGSLDTDLVKILSDQCLCHIKRLHAATIEMVSDAIRKSPIFKTKYTIEQIKQLIRLLVLDNKVIELKSTGLDEFDSIPSGTVCYKCNIKPVPKGSAMASNPCGVCPMLKCCTVDGTISPKTCRYYNKWLDF